MSKELGKGYGPQAIISHCDRAVAISLEADKEKAEIFGSAVQGAKALGVASLLTHQLSNRTPTAHSFDAGAMTAFKLGTGSDPQYWHTKLSEILKGHVAPAQLSEEDYDVLADDDPANLLRILAQYPEITHATYLSLEPAAIVTYLASVTKQLAECLDDNNENE